MGDLPNPSIVLIASLAVFIITVEGGQRGRFNYQDGEDDPNLVLSLRSGPPVSRNSGPSVTQPGQPAQPLGPLRGHQHTRNPRIPSASRAHPYAHPDDWALRRQMSDVGSSNLGQGQGQAVQGQVQAGQGQAYGAQGHPPSSSPANFYITKTGEWKILPAGAPPPAGCAHIYNP